MKEDVEQLLFASREAFREWLSENHRSVQGVWLVFGKKGGPETLSALEALEEALCFGWIDSQMRRLDETVYVKYFSQRRRNSIWSPRNKGLVAKLEQQGRMTDHGRAKVEEAKKTGMWDAPRPAQPTDEDAAAFSELLKGHEPAYTNFMAMSPSARRTYTWLYRGTITDEAKARRLQRIIERLNLNLRPM